MSKRDMVRAVYILYVIGFFTGLSTILGVIFAYFNRDSSSLLEKSHSNINRLSCYSILDGMDNIKNC